MKLSTFFNEKDNDPKLIEATWEGLETSLREVRKCVCSLDSCHRSDCAGKLGEAWNPAWWTPGDPRKAALVKEVCAFVIDFDKLTDLDLLSKVEGYKLIIHSSHSDSIDKRCLRVVVAMSKPVEGKQWSRFWAAAMRYLGIPLGEGGADTKCSDPGRIFFCPSRPYDACHEADDGSGFLFESSDGKLLDVDAILELVEDEEEAPQYTPTITSFRGAPSSEAWEEAVESLSGGWPDRGRHDCQRALAGALARGGWPVDLITDFLVEVCERATPGNGDRRKRAKAAREAVEGLASGKNVWGWATVKEHIDPESVDQATFALGLGGPRLDDTFYESVKSWPRAVAPELPGVGKLVTLSRDQIQSNLQAARRRLANSSSPKKILESKLIDRALKGRPFSDHSDENQDDAFVNGMRTVIKYADKGAPDIFIAELLVKSRPDIDVDTLCQMISETKRTNEEEILAELPLDDFEIDLRTGKPATGSQHNLDIALRRLGITFYFDAFSRKRVIETKVGDSFYRETVEDHHVIKLMFVIEQQFKFRPPKDLFYDYCAYRAHENQFHPVLNYLDGLESWDGVSRIDTWLIDFAGAEDTPYTRAVSRLILVAAVRRVRDPGCKFDEMLILESPQGSYKSTAIKTLCPNGDWFSDNFNLDGDSKKMIEQTSGKWIVEAGELRGMSARDHNALKQYLSSTHDEARMAYARETQRLARQFIIIGTTNDTQYLRDHTGDRRYWPIKIQVFDVNKLATVREQLWAEASYLEASGMSIRLDPSLYEAASSEQAKRRIDNPVKLKLEELLGDKQGRIKVSDVWRLLTDDHVASQNLINQAGNAMQEMGWTRIRVTQEDNRIYYYQRGNKEETKRVLHVIGNLNFGFQIKYAEDLEVTVLRN